MTFSKSDFTLIKWNLITFTTMLILSSAAITASENFTARALTEQRAAQNQLNEARRQLATANEDRENMKAYTLEYGSLLDRNIIGNDQRLDWIEGLDRIQQQGSVLDFKYSIAPQQIYTPAPPVDSGNYQLYLSTMTMQFNLLHEGQLMNFFDTLRSGIKGWFIIDQCTLERGSLTSDPANFNSAAKLKADCTGGWLTLKNRNAK